MEHIYSHAQNIRNERADHASALGTFGLVSNQNVYTRWTRPSFDSNSFFALYHSLGDIVQILCDDRTSRVCLPTPD